MAKLLVDELGWDSFLKLWESETLNLFKRYYLATGLYSGADEDHIASLEQETGVYMPKELFYGGIDYSPSALETSDSLRSTINLIREAITALQKITPDIFNNYKFDVFQRDSLRFPPASEEAILATEQRLELVLPESYKNFLRVSNGFYVMPGCTLAAVEIWVGCGT